MNAMAKKKLKDMQAKASDLIRKFWYPESPSTDEKTGMRVTLRYNNPTQFTEMESQARIRIKQAGKTLEEMAPSDARNMMLKTVLLFSVVKIEGCTFRKLRNLIAISADDIKEAGGLDAEVDTDPERSKDGEDNVMTILEGSNAFADWVARVSGDISRFQDSDWEERAKNSVSGAESTSEK